MKNVYTIIFTYIEYIYNMKFENVWPHRYENLLYI